MTFGFVKSATVNLEISVQYGAYTLPTVLLDVVLSVYLSSEVYYS